MSHIKTYEGLLDRFKKVERDKLIKSIESKLKDSNKYSEVLGSPTFSAKLMIIKKGTMGHSVLSGTELIDSITFMPIISKDLVTIEINRIFKYRSLSIGDSEINVSFSKYNISLNFRGLVDKIADKCIEIINNTYEKFNKDSRSITTIKIDSFISDLENTIRRKKEVDDDNKRSEYIRNEGVKKIQAYYEDFFERVDIVSIKDYLYDLSDILGEYEISKIGSTSVGYQIRWEDVDLLDFKKSMKVHSFKDYKDSFQTLELIKEFAHRIKFDYDIDVDYDHTGSDIVLTISEELPKDLKAVWQQLFGYRGPRKA